MQKRLGKFLSNCENLETLSSEAQNMESRSRLASPGVRAGCARGPFGVRSGSVRGPFGIRSGSAQGQFGVHSGFVRDSFGVRSRFVRHPFGVRSSPGPVPQVQFPYTVITANAA